MVYKNRGTKAKKERLENDRKKQKNRGNPDLNNGPPAFNPKYVSV